MAKVTWLIPAKEDLKEIYEFIASDSKKYAKHQVSKIRERIEILKTLPLAGKIVEEYEEATIREIISGNYRIIYRIIKPTELHILLIHHGARRFPKSKNKT